MSRETYVATDKGIILKSREGEYTLEYMEWSAHRKSAAKMLYGSDILPGGVNGILNHADGKRYDSKSQYERAVRAKGCRVVGNDWNNTKFSPREIRGDFNVRPALKQAIEKVLG